MGIALVWFALGCLWWALILGSLVVVGMRAPEGGRAVAVGKAAVAEGALVWATTLVPVVGAFVCTPLLFVAMLPVVVVAKMFGVDLSEALS